MHGSGYDSGNMTTDGTIKKTWLVELKDPSGLLKLARSRGKWFSLHQEADGGAFPAGTYLGSDTFSQWSEPVQVRDDAADLLRQASNVLVAFRDHLTDDGLGLGLVLRNVTTGNVVEIFPDGKVNVTAFMAGRATGHGGASNG